MKIIIIYVKLCFLFVGFDGQMDSMQGMDMGGSQHGSNYGPMDHMDLGPPPPPPPQGTDMNYEGMENMPPPPPPGHDQNQMAAWFDTDL